MISPSSPNAPPPDDTHDPTEASGAHPRNEDAFTAPTATHELPPREATTPFGMDRGVGPGELDPDLEPRDTVRTEVPDFPPEVLATYERQIRAEARQLAEARETSLSVRDIYPRAEAPGDEPPSVPTAPATMDVRGSEVAWGDSSVPRSTGLSADDLVEEPPSVDPSDRASTSEAPWSEPSPGEGVSAAIDYGTSRPAPAARLSFTAATLGGLFALAAGAGLFLVVSMLGARDDAPATPHATATPPSQVFVAEADVLAAVAEPELEPAEAAAEPQPELAAAEPSPETGPAPEAEPAPAPPVAETAGEPERDEARSDRLVAEARRARRAGQHDQALRAFHEALRFDARNPRAAAGLARTHLDRGEPVDAEFWVGRAIALRPKRASYQRLRAEILDAMGHTAAAAAARQDAADLARD